MKIQRIKLTQTLSGHPIFVYFIHNRKIKQWNQASHEKLENKSNVKKPKAIVFMARQHPGESVGSFLIQGIVDFLLESDEYDLLKRNYYFYIIPMVNVDGVFYGNYRTNLSGNDLNRMWRSPKRDYHCQIFSIKKFLIEINRYNQISLIIDIHGHSKSLNSFFYGNPPKKQALNTLQNTKIFPYFCGKKIRQISYTQSTFSISEDKKNTARVVLSQMFPKALVYTFENSFYGWKKGSQIVEHTIESYKKLGRDLLANYLEFMRIVEKNQQILEKLNKQIQDISLRENDQLLKSNQSDSQAENQLISFPESSSVSINKFVESKSQQHFWRPKIKKRSIKITKSTRKCLIPMPQTPNLGVTNENQKIQANSISQNIKKFGKKQNGFLSITKLNHKISNQSNSFVKSDFHDKTLKFYNERQLLIERLRKRKTNLQQSLNSASGVRSLLKTMGINIERK